MNFRTQRGKYEVMQSTQEIADNVSIDELIEKSIKINANMKGGNKKCFLFENYALLEGYIDENKVKLLISAGERLKSKGVNIARTLEYKLTDKEYGYLLQERAFGTPLHNRINYDIPKEDIPFQKQLYISRLEALAAESQKFYDKFVDDWLEIQNEKIKIDPSKTDNFYYQEGKGITFIDLEAVGSVEESEKSIETVCSEIAAVLSASNKYWNFIGDESVSDIIKNSLSVVFTKLESSLEKKGMTLENIRTILNSRCPAVGLGNSTIKNDKLESKESMQDKNKKMSIKNLRNDILSCGVIRTEIETQVEIMQKYHDLDLLRAKKEQGLLTSDEVVMLHESEINIAKSREEYRKSLNKETIKQDISES